MMSEIVLFHEGTYHRNIQHLLETGQISKKCIFYARKHLSAPNIIPLRISLLLKQNKNFPSLNLPHLSLRKTAAATPWWIDFAEIQEKCAE